MPGDISQSYDPEFGTAENAAEVAAALRDMRDLVTDHIGDPNLRYILDVIRGEPEDDYFFDFHTNASRLRILRFALDRALETL